MNCKKAEKKFSEYLENELTLKARLQLERHLGECDNCAYEWLAFQRTLRIVKDIPVVIIPSSDFDWQLRLRIAIEDTDKVSLRRRLFGYLRSRSVFAFDGVLALLLMLSVGLYFYISIAKISTSNEFLVHYVMPEISSKEPIAQWRDFNPESEGQYSAWFTIVNPSSQYLPEFKDDLTQPSHKSVNTNYILRTVSFTSDNVNKPF
ncbi:TPA: hypothetical protein EYP66_00385 [Candidatus Poribacteria bacterium]|nr:hypothetical protein [Candidatus Poribacteria bacterium]